MVTALCHKGELSTLISGVVSLLKEWGGGGSAAPLCSIVATSLHLQNKVHIIMQFSFQYTNM